MCLNVTIYMHVHEKGEGIFDLKYFDCLFLDKGQVNLLHYSLGE